MADAGAHDVGEWLASIGMQKYAPLFSAAKVETLAQVYELNETSLRELGVTVPGHVRRIILAQTELEKKLEHLALQVRFFVTPLALPDSPAWLCQSFPALAVAALAEGRPRPAAGRPGHECSDLVAS